jgi:hypothetical protein
MADFNIQPIGAQIKPVQGMSLGEMVNLARGAQAYQQSLQTNPLELQRLQQETRTGQIALGVEEQKDIERRNMQRFFADPNNFQTEGRIDLDKINAAVPSIAPLTGSEYINKYTTLGKAQTEAISAKQNLTQDQRSMIGSRFAVLGRLGVQDKNAYIAEMDLLKKENPDNKDLARLIDAYKVTWKEIPSGPQLPGIAIAGAQTLLTPAQQQTALAPQAGTLSTGEQIFPTVTTPAVGGMLPRIQMGAQPLADVGIPPTTEVINPATGERTLIGPASQRGKQQLITGTGPVQAGALEAQGTVIKEDLPRTISEAKDAPARIAIFQNIKKFAPESFTGVGGQRKELAAGILNAIGIPAYEQEKVSTEELAKNSALLALAGGNTDAARALAEVATPNKKLNEKAILAIADQMIGIENMREARAKYLVPFQNNAAEYLKRKQDFDSISDPRLFQEMSREDAVKMWKSMSPAQQAEILNMQKKARALGVIK